MTARTQQAGSAAIVGGLSWLAWDAARRTWSDGASSDCSGAGDVFSDATFAAANIGVAVSLFLLFTMLRGPARWFALAGSVASVLLATGNSLEHCVFEPFSLIYLLAATGTFVSLALLAVGLLLSRQLRWWQRALLLAAVLGMMLSYERGGAALTGIAWVAFGASMMAGGALPAASVAVED